MTIHNTIGRITRNLELKKSDKNGSTYTNFGLAVNEGYGDKKKTVFYECTAFGPIAERLINAKAQKGSLIHVVGRFGVSEFDRNNGEKGYSLKVTIYDWDYIPGAGNKKDGNGSNGNGSNNNGNGENGDSDNNNNNNGNGDSNANTGNNTGDSGTGCNCCNSTNANVPNPEAQHPEGNSDGILDLDDDNPF